MGEMGNQEGYDLQWFKQEAWAQWQETGTDGSLPQELKSWSLDDYFSLTDAKAPAMPHRSGAWVTG